MPANENQPPAPVSPGAPVAPEAAPIFSGPVSLWMGFKTFAFIAILIPLSIAMAIYGVFYETGNTQKALEIGGVALLLALNIMLVYLVFRIKSQRYTITTKLIERREGMFVQRTDAIDLARVKDVELTQSLVDRMMNIGTIEVISADKLEPDMRIEAIPNPRPVYEKLRDAVITLNQRRGIVTPE